MKRNLDTYDIDLIEILYMWVHTNVRTPIKGFEHKKHDNGHTYTYTQQLTATYTQLKLLIEYSMRRGKSVNELLTLLHAFTTN